MYLKVTSPDKTIFAWNIISASIPTEIGEITIMNNHIPLMSILKPGILKIQPEEVLTVSLVKDADFLFKDHMLNLSVSQGLIYVDGQNITILSNDVTVNPQDSDEVLRQMRQTLMQQVADLKARWDIVEMEKKIIAIEKINADIKLAEMKQ